MADKKEIQNETTPPVRETKLQEIKEETGQAVENVAKKGKKAVRIALFSAATVIALVIAGFLGFYYGTSKTETCRVTGSDRTATGTGKSTYRVYSTAADGTNDKCGTFRVEDTMAYFNFNSADLFGKMEKDQTYKIKSYGFRNGLFSWFPNIVKVDKTS